MKRIQLPFFPSCLNFWFSHFLLLLNLIKFYHTKFTLMTRHGKGNQSSVGEGLSRVGVSDSATPATTQQSGESQAEGVTTFAGQTVEQIEALVESFRTGKLKKSQTVFKISQILAAEPTGDEQLKADSLEQYASILDRIEAVF